MSGAVLDIHGYITVLLLSWYCTLPLNSATTTTKYWDPQRSTPLHCCRHEVASLLPSCGPLTAKHPTGWAATGR